MAAGIALMLWASPKSRWAPRGRIPCVGGRQKRARELVREAGYAAGDGCA